MNHYDFAPARSRDDGIARCGRRSLHSRLGTLGVMAAYLGILSGCDAPHEREHCEARCEISYRYADKANDFDGGVSRPSVTSKQGKRHVILMIGDGMELADEVATSRYLHGVDYGLSFHAFPVMSFKTTWTVDVYRGRALALGAAEYSPDSFDPRVGYDPDLGGKAPYPIEDPETSLEYFSFSNWLNPDSAGTATAMSTGTKTDNGAIAWSPGGAENGALRTSPEILRQIDDLAIGFVTTVPFSHATPGAFFAHNRYRTEGAEIAREILTQTRPDVVIGGGSGSGYVDQIDLDRALASNEWVFTSQQSGKDSNDALLAAAVLANQSNKRLLGIYGGGSVDDFLAPMPQNSPGHPQVDSSALDRPTLPNASIAALEVLSRDPEGFFLLIEQGHIDWANHRSNFGKMVGGVSELDQTVLAVQAFIDRPNDDIDWSNTTVILTADHANGYLRFAKSLGQGELPTQIVEGEPDAPVISYPGGEVSYSSASNHTSSLVAVYAKGYGATRVYDYEDVYPGYHIIDDTAIFHLVLDSAR